MRSKTKKSLKMRGGSYSSGGNIAGFVIAIVPSGIMAWQLNRYLKDLNEQDLTRLQTYAFIEGISIKDGENDKTESKLINDLYKSNWNNQWWIPLVVGLVILFFNNFDYIINIFNFMVY